MQLLLLTSAIALAAVATLDAQVIALFPSEDVFVSSANATFNYGGGGGLAVSAAGLPRGEFASLLRFDLAAAKSSFDTLWGAGAWGIESITFTLTANPPNNAIFNGNGAGPGGSNVNTAGLFSLQWLADDTWVEGAGTPQAPGATGLTYSGLSAVLGGSDEALGTFSFNGSSTGSTAYPLALTPAFSADVEAGNPVSFFAQPADASVAMVVNSRTGGIFARPTLTIVAVPEPACATLALAGLLMFAVARRRSRWRTRPPVQFSKTEVRTESLLLNPPRKC